MTDLSRHDQTENTQAPCALTSTRAEQVRAQSIRLIENVIKNSAHRKEIEIYLAIGAVCPFGSPADRLIWVEEARRLMAERGK